MSDQEKISFRQGEIHDVVIRQLKRHCDVRGWLVELFRHDEIAEAYYPVMAYASETLPGIARGPHEHRDQTDFFAFIGPGDFKLYLWDARPTSPTFGVFQSLVVGKSQPTSVLIPPGVVHAYKNISDEPGLVFNAPNRLYAGWGKKEPVDEIRHEDLADSPFQLD
ncbi:MAG: dTDP-4-dehydrorhamnose 3,5-epimerase family protein [Thermogutta sp.]|nr:dTDP-4-dehydrorhamnose 3,5-epimerase family protein [Thermogutta sp.]HQF14300.1 dTDP-4-dehydrorhamnose 3,5-epimerase family protein [Thermogutta sp.]